MIEGVTIRDLTVRVDERGSLTELLSVNMGDEDLCHVYVAMARPGVVKAFHAHLKQADRFVCIKGVAKIGMVDLRGEVFTAQCDGRLEADWVDFNYLADPDLVARMRLEDAEWINLFGESDTFLEHQTVILDSAQPQLLTIPPGVAHGQMALEGRSVILNAPTKSYEPSAPDELRIPYDSFGFVWDIQNR